MGAKVGSNVYGHRRRGTCSPPLPSGSPTARNAAKEVARESLGRRRAPDGGAARRCSSGAEQLTCNQQVVGSTPTIGSSPPSRNRCGEVPEWPKGADCKSAGECLRRFESSPLHSRCERTTRIMSRGSSSGGRARAFQARGRGFDSRLPLAHVAQAAEHFLGKEEVTGSNPVVGLGIGRARCAI